MLVIRHQCFCAVEAAEEPNGDDDDGDEDDDDGEDDGCVDIDKILSCARHKEPVLLRGGGSIGT